LSGGLSWQPARAFQHAWSIFVPCRIFVEMTCWLLITWTVDWQRCCCWNIFIHCQPDVVRPRQAVTAYRRIKIAINGEKTAAIGPTPVHSKVQYIIQSEPCQCNRWSRFTMKWQKCC